MPLPPQSTTLANAPASDFPSDHIPITTEVTIPPMDCRPGQGRRRIQHVLHRDLSDAQIQRILRNSQWPQRPYYRAATQLGLAELRETYISEFDKVEKTIRQIELLEDPDGELNQRLEELKDLLKQRGREADVQRRQELTNLIEREREETGILAFRNLQSLQRLEGAPRVRRVLDLLRKYIPKYFFKAVNRQLSFN